NSLTLCPGAPGSCSVSSCLPVISGLRSFFTGRSLTRLILGQARLIQDAALAASASAAFPSYNQRRRVGPKCAVDLGLRAHVDGTGARNERYWQGARRRGGLWSCRDARPYIRWYWGDTWGVVAG